MLMPRRSIAWPVSRNMKPAFRRSCITMAVAMAKRPLCSVDVHTQPGPPMSLPIRSDGDSPNKIRQGQRASSFPVPSPSAAARISDAGVLPTEKGDGSARAAGREAAGPRGARARRGPGGGWSRWARAVG
jgi:hypothetical protein